MSANKFKQLGLPTLSAWIALFLFLVLGAFRDALLLFKHPVAVGFDGYYYALQVSTLRTEGHFYFPTRTPFVFYLMSLSELLSRDVIHAIKISAIILHALLCLGIALLIIQTTRAIWLGALGTLLASISHLHFYFESEFIKSLCACCLILLGFWTIIKWTRRGRTRWLYGSLALFLAALLSHKLGLFLILFAATTTFSLRLLFSSGHNKRRLFAGIAILCSVMLAPLFLSLLKYSGRHIPLVEDTNLRPRLPFDIITFPECLILLVTAPLTLFLLYRLRRRLDMPAIYLYGGLSLTGVLLILNPFLNTDRALLSATIRVRMLSYIVVAALVPGTIFLLSKIYSNAPLYFLTFVITLMVILNYGAALPKGMQDNYLLERASLLRNLPSSRSQLGDRPLVIAAHGNQFVVTWALQIPSQQEAPSDNFYQSTFWLLSRANSLTGAGTVVGTEGSNAPYVLIEDHRLRQQMKELDEREREQLYGYNRLLLESLCPDCQSQETEF